MPRNSCNRFSSRVPWHCVLEPLTPWFWATSIGELETKPAGTWRKACWRNRIQTYSLAYGSQRLGKSINILEGRQFSYHSTAMALPTSHRTCAWVFCRTLPFATLPPSTSYKSWTQTQCNTFWQHLHWYVCAYTCMYICVYIISIYVWLCICPLSCPVSFLLWAKNISKIMLTLWVPSCS